MNRDSFIFHREWFDAIEGLDDNVRFEIFDAIIAEAFDLEKKKLSPLAKMAMTFIRQRLNSDKERYESICRRNSTNGAKGGRPKKTQNNPNNPVGILGNPKKPKETQENPEKPKKADIDIQDTNVSMSIIEEKETKVSTKKVPAYPAEFDSDWFLYGRKGSKKDSYAVWKSLTEEEKEKMRRHIPHYLQSNDRQYLKDFERYIKHRVFESPVYRQSNLLFDPQTVENNQAGLYDPSGWLNYDENLKAWRYFGREPKYDLHDGYTDENRPNGARVVTQRTIYTWSSLTKTWSVTQ